MFPFVSQFCLIMRAPQAGSKNLEKALHLLSGVVRTGRLIKGVFHAPKQPFRVLQGLRWRVADLKSKDRLNLQDGEEEEMPSSYLGHVNHV